VCLSLTRRCRWHIRWLCIYSLLLLLLYLRLLLYLVLLLLLLLRWVRVLLLVSVCMLHRLVHTPRYLGSLSVTSTIQWKYHTHAHSFEVILQPVSFYPRNIRRSRESNVFRNTTEDADLLVVLCLLPDLGALLAR
jgi:hypothetical protein